MIDTTPNEHGLGWRQRHMLAFVRRHSTMTWENASKRFSYAKSMESVALSLQSRGLVQVDTITQQIRIAK